MVNCTDDKLIKTDAHVHSAMNEMSNKNQSDTQRPDYVGESSRLHIMSVEYNQIPYE